MSLIQDITRDLEHLNAGTIHALAEKAGEGSLRALMDVIKERYRQIAEEGWTPEHDDTHVNGEMAKVATCYTFTASSTDTIREVFGAGEPPPTWPDDWDSAWWKPTDRRRALVKAAALILAEIERLDRSKGGAS